MSSKKKPAAKKGSKKAPKGGAKSSPKQPVASESLAESAEVVSFESFVLDIACDANDNRPGTCLIRRPDGMDLIRNVTCAQCRKQAGGDPASWTAD